MRCEDALVVVLVVLALWCLSQGREYYTKKQEKRLSKSPFYTTALQLQVNASKIYDRCVKRKSEVDAAYQAILALYNSPDRELASTKASDRVHEIITKGTGNPPGLYSKAINLYQLWTPARSDVYRTYTRARDANITATNDFNTAKYARDQASNYVSLIGNNLLGRGDMAAQYTSEFNNAVDDMRSRENNIIQNINTMTSLSTEMQSNYNAELSIMHQIINI